MNKNVVAAECCGSCKYFYWNGFALTYKCHKPEIPNCSINNPAHLCIPSYYSPRETIPLIDVPGVKELVKNAWLAGCYKGHEWTTDKENEKTLADFMKSLEATDG